MPVTFVKRMGVINLAQFLPIKNIEDFFKFFGNFWIYFLKTI